MLKDLTNKEYLLLHGVNLKYNRYYISNIRLYTKTTILKAIRLNLKISVYDTLLKEWSLLVESNNYDHN